MSKISIIVGVILGMFIFSHFNAFANTKIVVERKKIEIVNGHEKASDIIKTDSVEIKQDKPNLIGSIVAQATGNKSKYLNTVFGKNNKKTGQQHLDQCNSTEAGKTFLQAFAEYGADDQVIACASLNYENGTHDLLTRGVCNAKYMENGDYRRCNYADINSAGFDIGLFQINTYYQAKTITRLGGPACNFVNSRDWTDPCVKLKAEWLFDINNQIKIIKDIYSNQGFTPWVAYLINVKPFL
jgi:hypothetical protein